VALVRPSLVARGERGAVVARATRRSKSHGSPFSPGEAGDGSLPGGLVCGTAGAWETEENEGGRAGSGTADGARFPSVREHRYPQPAPAPLRNLERPSHLETSGICCI
jgi:hypothetical protein